MLLGVGFTAGCVILAAWETLILRNYDPLLGNPEGVFLMLAALSLVPSAGAAMGALIGGVLAPPIATRHAVRVHMMSIVAGVAIFGLMLGLNALRVWLADPRHRAGQIENAVAAFSIPFLTACLTWWLVITWAVYRRWFAIASKPGEHCETCGYDLRGSGTNPTVCPECGNR